MDEWSHLMVLGYGRSARQRRGSSTEGLTPPPPELLEVLSELLAHEAEELKVDAILSLSSQIWGTPSGVHLFFCPAHDHVMVMFDNDPSTLIMIGLTPAILDDLEEQVLPKLAAHAALSDSSQAREREKRINRDFSIARKVTSGSPNDEAEEPESEERPADDELATAHAAAERAIREFVERHKPSESPQD